MTIDGIKVILKNHLTRRWNSTVTAIAAQIFFVECGVKTGFILDIGPPIDLKLLIDILSDLRQSKLVSHSLRIVRIVDDICILNVQSYCDIQLNDVTFINITASLREPQLCDQSKLADWLAAFNNQIHEFQRISNELFFDVQVDRSFCIPTLFGLVAGFPVIYYYNPLVSDQNCLANVLLRVYQIWFRNEILIFSVSCPAKLIDDNVEVDGRLKLWRDRFEGYAELKFKVMEETLPLVVL